MIINNRDYIEYIIQRGSSLNKELKNNIDYCHDDLIRLLLIDYIKETMENYDYRNCPNYDNIEKPILSEDNKKGLITEDSLFLFLTELEDSVLITEDSYYEDYSHLEPEEYNDYLELEGDYQKYIFDKLLIERILQHLIKDITCLE